ncbi:MAG: Holliday junction branch migration protein RuvA [Candidatus Omnitrophica bacterium]|nr:Holliday junction branch migration protein RuvA [Candidatus Omnitrophota bacterium]MCM8777676.1 Holliday junction branch migration protein RuvA [Candidatus Omnitrophota bacterium]
MIYYIQGKLVSKSPTRVVVENNGIGYTLSVSLETSHSIGEEGDEIKLFTYQIVREEELQLYGFATEKEREAFLMLISVPGIGPKVALRILSGLTTEELYQAILSEDISLFTEVPGVGKKTGERLIVELRQKIEKLPVLPGKEEKIERDVFTGAVEALIVLGYKRKDAVSAVSRVMKEAGRALGIEEVIKEALKRT